MTTNTVIKGDCGTILNSMDPDTIDLIFTSPPYFNARPEYSTFQSYEIYLQWLAEIITKCHKVLREGRYFIINTSPVLIPREDASKMSTRLAIPFDLNPIIQKIGFDFIDDIVWVKPKNSGVNRTSSFNLSRKPLMYKTNPITEYVMVYRKHTDKKLSWNIANSDPKLVEESMIKNNYEKTNVWYINPSNSKSHPAVFPYELARKIIMLYSIKDDTVLDPFAGTGTTGRAAMGLGRYFTLIEKKNEYFDYLESMFTDKISLLESDVNIIK